MTCKRCHQELPAHYLDRGLCPRCRCHVCNGDLATSEEFVCGECETRFEKLVAETAQEGELSWTQ